MDLLDKKNEEIEQLNRKSKQLMYDLEDAKEEILALRQSIVAKDLILADLTNKLYDLESEAYESHSSNITQKQRRRKEKTLNEELESLKDSVTAYQDQNKYLNGEIIKLNEQKSSESRKSQELQHKCYDLEAKYCQIHSKLLSLLKEIKRDIDKSDTTKGDQLIPISSNVRDLVLRLFEEIDVPISWLPGNRKRTDSSIKGDPEHDCLGFTKKQPDVESELNETPIADFSLDTSNRRLLAFSTEDIRLDQSRLWDDFVIKLKSDELKKGVELKYLLRCGIPQQYRAKIWKMLISLRIKKHKDKFKKNYFDSLCAQANERNVNPAVKQIELDLLRTLPNNKNFNSIESGGVPRLRRVLTAYSLHDPTVGYCQGMNRLAAVALLYLLEEDAFWCLVAIIESIMPPNYFVNNLLGVHVDQYVLRDLMAEKMPQLHSHFEKHNIELSLFSWFLTCFVDNIPHQIYLRIWDVFLYEGNKVLFRFALAFLEYHSKILLNINDSLAINQYLRLLGYRTYNISHLFDIAFNKLNPLSKKAVENKRKHYTEWMTNELQKLDQMRKSFPARLANDNSDSEEEKAA